MSIKVIQPVLIVPGGEAPQADVDAVNAACRILQQWWETRYRPDLLSYVMRPLSPPCTEDTAWFLPGGSIGADDRAWSQTKKWIADSGYSVQLPTAYGVNPNDVIWLVFLKDYHDARDGHEDEWYSWFAWGGPMTAQEVPLRIAVVDYSMIDDLKGVTLDAISDEANKAMGLICHEAGHCFGWQHTDTPHPNIMSAWWIEWPAVNVPPK